MAATSLQFAVATHIMTALGYYHGDRIHSDMLAQSLNADPTFVRKSLAKLVRAGLVVATRGKNGSCALARAPERITLRDIYLASEAPNAFELHCYPVEKQCPVSAHFRECMVGVQSAAQRSVEQALAQTTLADIVTQLRKRVKKR
jgi:Rrf2 family protein